MKRKYAGVLGLFLLFIIDLPLVLKHWVARVQAKLNPVLSKPIAAVSPKAARLHASLRVADLHSDILLWGVDLNRRNKTGHVDVPRLLEGNVALQVFSVVTKVPKVAATGGFDKRSDQISILAKAELWPPKTWNSLSERALYQSSHLHRFARRSRGRLVVIDSAKGLQEFLAQRQVDPNRVAGVLSLEGAHALDGRLENIDILYEAGFRIIGLQHFYNNELGSASIEGGQAGLTEFGRQVVQRLHERGIIVDLAHSSPLVVDDVLDLTSGPLIVTHTGVDGVCPSPRNVSDEQIGRLVERGGLVGIGFDPFFNCAPGVQLRHLP